MRYKYRPSALKRRMLCPASACLENEIAERDTSNQATIDGTRIHDALAKGECPESFNSSMRWIYEYCTNFINTTFSEAVNVTKEKLLQLKDNNGNIIIEGTPDITGEIINQYGSKIIIADWKSGFNEVEDVVENIQLACYAVMAMYTYGVNEAEAYIVQPRINKVDSFTFSNKEAIKDYIVSVIDKCERLEISSLTDDDFASNDTMCNACKYCRAKTTCPKQLKQAIAITDVMSVDKTESMLSASPEELVNIYLAYNSKIQMLNEFWKEVKDKIKEYAKANGDVCGDIKLTYRSARDSSIKDDDIQSVYKIMMEYITPSEFMQCVALSPKKLIDVFTKHTKAYNKANNTAIKMSDIERDCKEKINSILSPYIKQGEPTVILTPINNK